MPPRARGRHPGDRSACLRGLGDGQAEGLELHLEEMLVDLPVIDRDAFLDAEPDDLVTIHAELVRELLRRQVVRHASASFEHQKSPPAQDARSG